MRPVTEGRILRVLAVAEKDLAGFFQGELLGGHAGSFVGAIAERLMTRKTTGTPPMVSSFKFNADGLGIKYFWEVAHNNGV